MEQPNLLWSPSPDQVAASQMASFLETVNTTQAAAAPLDGYPALHQWSVNNREAFWELWLRVSGLQTSGTRFRPETVANATIVDRQLFALQHLAGKHPT